MAVDWWGFGVLLYEMLVGQAPFFGRSENEIFNSILAGRPRYPPSLDSDACDLIKKVHSKYILYVFNVKVASQESGSSTWLKSRR